MKLKTILIIGLAAMTCATTVSARARKKKPTMAEVPQNPYKPVDGKTFSYAFGVMQGEGLRNYLIQREGVDSLYISEAVKGLNAEYSEEEVKKYLAFAAGLRIAEMNRKSLPSFNQNATGKADTTYLDLPAFQTALSQVLLKEPTALTPDSAQKVVEQQANYQQENYRLNNIEWLKRNAKAEGVKVLPDGLQYRVLTQGTGVVATDTTEVEVEYEGKLIDGTVFDSSYKRGKPATFRPDQVIQGWKEALTMMPEGSKWELFIPAELGYSTRAMRNIPANSTLIFTVEIKKVKVPEAKEAEKK